MSCHVRRELKPLILHFLPINPIITYTITHLCLNQPQSLPNCSRDSTKTNKSLTNFLDKAGKKYWKETTKWEDLYCLWEVAIAIKLAKQGQDVTWKHTTTSKPPADLKDKTLKEVLDMAHLGFLGQKQHLRKTLPPFHKERNEDVAIEMNNQEKTTLKKRWNKTWSSKRKTESSSQPDAKRAQTVEPTPQQQLPPTTDSISS